MWDLPLCLRAMLDQHKAECYDNFVDAVRASVKRDKTITWAQDEFTGKKDISAISKYNRGIKYRSEFKDQYKDVLDEGEWNGAEKSEKVQKV